MKLKNPFSLSKIKSLTSSEAVDISEEDAISKIRSIKKLASAETKMSIQDSLREIEAKERHISADEVFVEDFLSALRPLIDENPQPGPPSNSPRYH